MIPRFLFGLMAFLVGASIAYFGASDVGVAVLGFGAGVMASAAAEQFRKADS